MINPEINIPPNQNNPNQTFNQPFNQAFNQAFNLPPNNSFNPMNIKNTPNSQNQFFEQQQPPGFNGYPPLGQPLPAPINLISMGTGIQEA